MKSTEILQEVLKDPILTQKYGINEQDLEKITFDESSEIPIIKILKVVIQQKNQGYKDSAIYSTIRLTF